MAQTKFYVAVIGGGITAALGVVPPDSLPWKVLTVAAAVITAVSVYAVENREGVNALQRKLTAAKQDGRV